MKNEKEKKILAFVKSKRVPVAITYVEKLHWSAIGILRTKRSVVQYETRLGESGLAALEYARELASFANLSLEVVDLSKTNFLSRLVRRVIPKMQTPFIEIPGAVLPTVLGFSSTGS